MGYGVQFAAMAETNGQHSEDERSRSKGPKETTFRVNIVPRNTLIGSRVLSLFPKRHREGLHVQAGSP